MQRRFGTCKVLINGDVSCKLSRTLSTMKNLGNHKTMLHSLNADLYMSGDAEIKNWRVDNSGSLWRGGMRTELGPKVTSIIAVSSEFLYKRSVFLYYLFH